MGSINQLARIIIINGSHIDCLLVKLDGLVASRPPPGTTTLGPAIIIIYFIIGFRGCFITMLTVKQPTGSNRIQPDPSIHPSICLGRTRADG